MSQLPDERGRDFKFRVFVLHDSIRVLRTLSDESDTVLYEYAFPRYSRRSWAARNDADQASASSTAARSVLLDVGSARLKSAAELLNGTKRRIL